MPFLKMLQNLLSVSSSAMILASCTPWDNEFGGTPDYYLGTSIEKGRMAISFTAQYDYVQSSGRDPNVVIIEALEKSLMKINLCPNGYVVDRKIRYKNLDYGLILDCKKGDQ